MKSAPTIPGMSRFPELEKKYKASYARAQSAKGCDSGCDSGRVVRSFREKLEQRVREQRDN